MSLRPEWKPAACAAGFLLFVPALALAEPPTEFHYDFRKLATKPGSLRLFGKNAKKHIHFTASGVEFSLPNNAGKGIPAIGFGPLFKIKGDFEITAAFQVLEEADPAPGSFGLNLHIYVDTRKSNAATIVRSRKPGGSIQVLAHELVRDAEGKAKHSFQPQSLAGKFTSGKLKLKRTGSKLAYFYAEGDSSVFHKLHETTWVSDNVRFARIGGTNSKAATPFRFRIVTLDIEGGKLPAYEVPPSQTSWWLIAAIGGLVVAGGVGGVVGFRIWRKRNKS